MIASGVNPDLIVIAGPNGSGKTVFTGRLLRHEWAENCVYVNPDEIARERFGDWNDPEAVASAAREATRWRYETLRNGTPLMFETVFSSPEKPKYLEQARKAGFFIRMFFIGTDGPEINARRVSFRSLQGGHDVPGLKIFERYGKSLANLPLTISVCDRVYVYDNSVDGRDPDIQFRTREGRIEKVYADPVR